MDLYHIWCDLKPGVSDIEFAENVGAYLGRLASEGRISSFRVSRRKLGLGPSQLGEFHVCIEIENLAQLDEAFREVSSRTGPIESLHAAVNQTAINLTFALYRDFPDSHRRQGDEQF
jgi:hypothetical protein